MPRRIIVSFRGAVPATPADGARYIAQALAMKKRAEAHGATLCGWSALTFSFCFEPDELEEAVRLAAMVFEDAGAGLCAGLAEGDLASIGERVGMMELAWGMPLVRATSLSRAAAIGEVLADDHFYGQHGDEVVSFGFRGEGEPIKRLRPIEAELEAEERDAAERDAAQREAAKRNAKAERDAAERDAAERAEAAAETGAEEAPQDAGLAGELEPESVPASSIAPTSMRVLDPVAETAKRALLQGDIAALERLIAELRETGEHANLVERMSGFVALRRGATADALRRLRAATEAAREPAQRARARLAYGVALAGAGRTESALLEALEALARAREAGDLHGEHACALFLARLSSRAGQPDAASVWAMVAAKAEAAQT